MLMPRHDVTRSSPKDPGHSTKKTQDIKSSTSLSILPRFLLSRTTQHSKDILEPVSCHLDLGRQIVHVPTAAFAAHLSGFQNLTTSPSPPLTATSTNSGTQMARHGKAKARAKRATAMAATKSSPHQFSMQQEARNTETHGRTWSNNNLRHKAVTFVSAGEVQRSEFENADQEDRHTQTQNEPPHDGPQADFEKPPTPTEEPQENLFYFDPTGQTTTATGFPDPTLQLKPLDSDTSEDEVVFTGRKNHAKPVLIETDANELRAMLQKGAPKEFTETSAPDTEQITTQVDESDISRSNTASHVPKELLSQEANDPLADYIANIDRDYYDEADEDLPSHKQVDIRNGMNAGSASGRSEVSDLSSTDDLVAVLPGAAREHGNAFAKVPEEPEVQSSIDVLSRMYLDADLNTTPVPGDESEELTPSEESDADSEDEDDVDAELLEELAIEYSMQHKNGCIGSKRSFPSASAFADALEADPYYGFDIMDFDRPSLQKKGKGKQPPALDLMFSDSDMESHLQEVWQSDRKRKKAKKKEREELRSQGLLGRSPGDPDLKTKYSKGMNVEEFITEIRSFLLSSRTSLSLPPMTKNRRKAIHGLANVVNLKSQSRGDGPARFTMLLKTSRTPGYTRKTISKVDSLLSGRKLNRRLFQSWGPDAAKPTKSKPKRGGVGGAVSYMEGDVVGASAPEIGAENRGRAMLEKMGWSSGTALGASNNKGILQPVAHVVKNSRAGLG